MPFDDLPKLRDFNEYKKVLKTELGKVRATPVRFQIFEKFKFASKTAPFLIVGKCDSDFVDAIKDGGAVFKAKGRCAKNDVKLEFVADQGTIPESALAVALADGGAQGSGVVVKVLAAGNAGKDDVLAEKQAEGEVHSGPGGSKSEAPKQQAERRLAEVTKFFDGVKGALPDKLRATTRGKFEAAQKSLAAGQHDAAIKALAVIEADVQREVLAQKVSIEKSGKEANDAADANKAKLAKIQADIDAADKRVAALDKEWKDSKGQKSGEKFAVYEKRLATLTKRIDEEKARLAEKRSALATDLKAAETTDAAKVKELLTRFLGLARRAEELSRAANEPVVGRIADNPALAQAREAVKPGMEKMAAASQFLKAEHERTATDARMHGSARHGAQSGLDRGAARAGTKNEFRPDSPENRDGVTRHLRTWNKVELTWEDLPGGKKKLTDRKLVTQTVLAQTFPGENPSSTTSMFLNPVLEKEAVDAALKIARDRCPWKYKANGNPLLELGIALKRSPGWGYSISKMPGVQKKSVAEALALLQKFEEGQLTIDALLERLNVQIATDRTGAGALLVPYAKVVLVRPSVDADWHSKTHYPDDRINAAGWEIEGERLSKTRNGPLELVPPL